MERFDEVDSSGRQVTTTNDDATGSHDTAIDTTTGSHDTTTGLHDTTSVSRDTTSVSHDPPRSVRSSMSATRQLPVGKPPSGSVTSKIDSHRVAGMTYNDTFLSAHIHTDTLVK